jgi:uncharacterized secreted protein with C-terminal beta-propeller domain
MDTLGVLSKLRLTRGIRVLAAIMVLLPPAGCWHHDHDDPPTPSPNPTNPSAALKLHPMANCDAYKDYVATALIGLYTRRDWIATAAEGDVMAGNAGTPAGGASTSSSPPDRVTGTNVQEAGVDEADIVKTAADGTLYVAHRKSLRIVRGHPPSDMQELGAIDVGATIRDFFLDDSAQRAVVFAYDDVVWAAVVSPWPNAYMPRTTIAFIDVADAARPRLTAKFRLDGWQVESRRVNSRVHVVLNNALALPAALRQNADFSELVLRYYQASDEDQATALRGQIEQTIRAAVPAADPAEFLPMVTTDDGAAGKSAPLLACSDVQAPQVVSRPQLLIIASVDTDGGNLSATAITAGGAFVYSSAQHLYVAHHSGGWWEPGGAEWAPKTAIHKFAIDGTTPVYRASGLVDGWVNDSFSLGEHDDDLRVATNVTTWSDGAAHSTNHLFVLRENDAGELVEHGAVRDFGKDERIFGARFLGTRAFVVTFRQIDPLFAFDLSDPAHPKLAGELTIPGFSTYLHPLDDDHLLTVGRDGTTRQLQLQIFDVSDLAQPALLHKYAPSLPSDVYSYSEAEYDHHAFTYDEVNRVLALPLAYFGAGPSFNGIAAFNVDVKNGFSEIVRVDHGDLALQAYCGGNSSSTFPCSNGSYVWYAYPRRSVIMTAGDARTLYSVSGAGVKATDLAPPYSTRAAVVFPNDPIGTGAGGGGVATTTLPNN